MHSGLEEFIIQLQGRGIRERLVVCDSRRFLNAQIRLCYLKTSCRATLLKLCAKGPAGNFDTSALNRLFTLGLITVNSDRCIILTADGKTLCDELIRHAEANNTSQI